MLYDRIAGVDDDYNFPPEVRDALANSTEVAKHIYEVIASDSTVIGAAAAAVEFAIDDLAVVTANPTSSNDDAVGGMVDEKGRPAPFMTVDFFGRPSHRAVRAAQEKGFLAAVNSSGETEETDSAGFEDSLGRKTWLRVGSDGGPDDIAKWAIVNAVGFYFGPDVPFVWPGRTILWRKRNEDGTYEDFEVSNP